jgi:integrase
LAWQQRGESEDSDFNETHARGCAILPSQRWLHAASLVRGLRRTLGSWLASSGTSLPIIGRALIHKTPEATMVYARLIVAPDRNAMEEATAAIRKTGEL